MNINDLISTVKKKLENNLKMDMWLNSDGEDILNIFNKLKVIDLSNDAKEIINISILTN